MDSVSGRPRLAIWAFCTAAVALVAYANAFRLPLISDDFVVIAISRGYGEPGGWTQLANDALYRCRAVFMILTHFLDRWFGPEPRVYNAVGVSLHVINCLLVLALGVWPKIGWRLSIPAAFFFAFWHGHQEAVIWYSALPDELVMAFSLAAILVWVRWLAKPSPWLYSAAMLLYLLSLASKESGVATAGFLGLVMIVERRSYREIAVALWPFALVASVYFVAGFADRREHLHYNDGTFTLGAHFISVIVRSTFRMLWVWGFVAAAAIAIWSWKKEKTIVWLSLAWMAIGLLPYGFLTYMPHVPSRHTYVASVGLALIVAAGFTTLMDRFRSHRAAVLALAAVVCLIECSFLWNKKHQQFVERAEPTERLIRALKNHRGELIVRCFPLNEHVVQAVIELHYRGRVTLRAPASTAGVPRCEERIELELVAN